MGEQINEFIFLKYLILLSFNFIKGIYTQKSSQFCSGIRSFQGLLCYNSMALIYKAFCFISLINARHELGESSSVRK